MVAINAALAVDLTGQVCADSIGRSIYSGFGGQADFIRGAARARRGKPIIALPSTAKGGTLSRIVDALPEGAGVVTTARGRPLRRDRARHRGAARQEPARAGPGAHRGGAPGLPGGLAPRGTRPQNPLTMAEPSGRARSFLRRVFFLGRNRISTAGAVLTTGSALTMIGFWSWSRLQAHPVHPYAGIVLFLILPVVFVLGLLLIPLGVLLRRRKLRAARRAAARVPAIDLQQPEWRHGLRPRAAVATVVNVGDPGRGVLQGRRATWTRRSSAALTCHTRDGARVHGLHRARRTRASAACSATSGPAPAGSCKSKLSGTRQVFAVTFNTYSRPIPSPVKHLRPARETCEQCHWPQKFHGDKLLVRTKYADDEANTPLTHGAGAEDRRARAANGSAGHPRPPPRRQPRASATSRSTTSAR